MLPVHCPGPADSNNLLYVRLGWQKKHQNIPISDKKKPNLKDIPDLLAQSDGVKKYF